MQAKTLRTNANLFKILGHAKRLEIICLLQGHSLTVGQIVQMTALRQSAVSQNLTVLREQGLVRTVKLGKEIYYSFNSGPLADLARFAKNLTHVEPLENTEPTVVDPICRMHLTPSTANHIQMYDGIRHYFCGKGCLKEFNGLHKGAI